MVTRQQEQSQQPTQPQQPKEEEQVFVRHVLVTETQMLQLINDKLDVIIAALKIEVKK